MKTYMAQRATRVFQLSLLSGTCFLWAGLLIPVILHAAPNISARYVQSQGTQLMIEIIAGSNPPASAILIQQLPPGVRILSSRPEAKNYNANKSSAKWLLRNLEGRSTVSMTLDRAVTGAEISAELRFKPQKEGKMATIRVEK